MTISALTLTFSVSSVDFNSDTSVRVNVKKRIEEVFYKTLSSRDKVNVGYIIGKKIIPATSLFISDRSTTLPQNRLLTNVSPSTTTAASFLHPTDKILLTNQFTTAIPTQSETPLFYYHQLSQYNTTNLSNRTILSLSFTDIDYNIVDISDYLFDDTTGKVYNNLSNTISETEDNDIYYVKYTVSIVSGGQTTVQVYSEILNNKLVFHPASFEDLDDTASLDVGSFGYLSEQVPGGSYYNIITPTNTLYAWKDNTNSKISISSTVAQDNENPWYVNISNGSFLASLPVSSTANKIFKYYIPEFNSQSYNPFPPYNFEKEQLAILLSDRLIKVGKNIVLDSGLGFYVDILVKGLDESVVGVYTNNPEKINTAFSNTVSYQSGISSIDETNGIIETSFNMLDNQLIYVDYYTERKDYEWNVIDFNPINNLNITLQKIVLYVMPETAETGTLTQSVHYLIVNSIGQILYCSQVVDIPASADAFTTKLLTEDFNTDGTPKHTFYYDIESSPEGLGFRASGVNLAYQDEFSFVDKYTVESALLDEVVPPSGVYAAYLNYQENPRALILGDISVGNNQSVEDFEILDVRLQGGGIKEENVELAMDENPEVSWFWDLATIKQIPSANAFLVEVPQTVLTENGGRFSLEEVKDIVEKHMAFGSYPVIQTYGTDPVITSAYVGSGFFTIGWPSYGDDEEYDVFYSNTSTSNFTQANTSGIQNENAGNFYTVSGLLNKSYYIKLKASDNTYSQTIKLTLPNE